jgi:hypothetical protein
MANKSLSSVFLPPAKKTEHDTGLRFTDILFGFVITQIFLRLQNWGSISDFNRWQLICSTALVLGSWIGFRRSLNRRDYELKFFNLPLFRFLIDQVMLIFYFYVATLTPLEPGEKFNFGSTAEATVEALLIVFGLYFVWDLLGLWMAKIDKYKKEPDWFAPLITLVFLAGFGVVLWWVKTAEDFNATLVLVISAGLLVAYRWVKEIRTTWRSEVSTPGTEPSPAQPS